MSVRIENHRDEVERAINQALERALEGVGVAVEREAKKEIRGDYGEPERIDTGLLRNSIAYALSGKPASISTYTSDNKTKSGSYSGVAPDDGDKAVFIGTNVEYGIYVHEGTVRMSPNRFLKNAVERNTDQIKEYIEDALKNG